MLNRFFILTFVFVFSFTALGQKNTDFEALDFEKFVKERMAADKIPGLSIGFIKGETIWTKGFGYADIENGSPVSEKSMYRLASVTKPMTATAILQLVEKGKIDLDAEVQKYVPYFPKKKYPVTVRNLLGHIGGISHYKDYSVEGHFKEKYTTKQSLTVFQDWDLIAEPGTRFNYTSYGYNLLGAVIEGASGMSYGDYMRKNVWTPLGMETIVMDDPIGLIPNRVRGYEITGGKVVNSEFVNISSRFAAGGTRASVIDMLRFGKGMMDGKVLSKTMRNFMFTSMLTKDGFLTNYGAGIQVAPVGGRYTLQHSGAQQETATHLYVFPSRKLVIAVAINLEGANRGVFISKLFEAVTGEAWEVKPYGVDPDLFAFMRTSFVQGRAYFEKYRKASTTETGFVDEIATIQKLISSSAKDLARKFRRDAAKPNSSFEKIGSFMAAQIVKSHGVEKLNSYSNSGSLGFFSDYISLAAKDTNRKLSFDASIGSRIQAYEKSWSKTNIKPNKDVSINVATDLSQLSERLKAAFSGETVYPDFSEKMVSAVQEFAVRGEIQKSLQIAKLAVDLYPRSDETNANYGILLLLSGQQEAGFNAFKRSLAINPRGTASARGLIGVAGQLFQLGMHQQGLGLLQVADQLHPSNALVLYRIGDYYRRAKNKTKAIEYFRKSLAVDPDFENARRDLKKLLSTDQ